MVRSSAPRLLSALWLTLAAPQAWALPGNHTAGRRLSGSAFFTTLPAWGGCHAIVNLASRSDCCMRHDARGDFRYEGQPCTPSFLTTGGTGQFSSGNSCEPQCWTRGECGSGSDQGDDIAPCPSPTRPRSYSLGQGGLTCEQQFMVDLTEDECYGHAKDAVGLGSHRTEANSELDVPYGCFLPHILSSVLFQGAQGPPAKRATPCSDLKLPSGSEWKDLLRRGCDHYASDPDNCRFRGDLFPTNGGLTANRVCCTCGGGPVVYSPPPPSSVRYICGSIERV